MTSSEAPRRVPPVAPVNVGQPVDTDQFEEFLYSIDRLSELPVAEIAAPAQIAEKGVYVCRLVIPEPPTQMRRHILFRPTHDPPIEGRFHA